MKNLFLLIVIFFHVSVLKAAESLNHVSCLYVETSNGWNVKVPSPFFYNQNFSLATGQKKQLSGMMTINSPGEPNFAYCTALVGTQDPEKFMLQGFSFSARRFTDPLGYNGPCSINGLDLRMSRMQIPMQRGDTADFQFSWYPQRRLLLKVYLPFENELGHLNELAAEKCRELIPPKIN